MIDTKTKVCCVVGHPVTQSLSPIMHNAAYEKLGLNYIFLAFDVTALKSFTESIKVLNIKGVSVTIPHKIEIMKYLDHVDPIAKEIGAVNTIVNSNGKLTGHNTDWIGAIKALEEKTTLLGKKVALIGNGGAARAISYGLKKRKADVSSIDRSRSQNQLDTLKNADIIINATPVGMTPNDKISPIPSNAISANQVVFDIVFKPHKTQLLSDAEKRGATIVFGLQMLVYGLAEQFKLFTGVDAPLNDMKNAVQRFEIN